MIWLIWIYCIFKDMHIGLLFICWSDCFLIFMGKLYGVKFTKIVLSLISGRKRCHLKTLNPKKSRKKSLCHHSFTENHDYIHFLSLPLVHSSNRSTYRYFIVHIVKWHKQYFNNIISTLKITIAWFSLLNVIVMLFISTLFV